MTPTADQQAAIDWLDHSSIVAVPGSGKTGVLIMKITKMLNKGHRRILIASFTNAAADEIRHRLNSRVDKSLMKYVVISTIHSVMLDHIKKNIGSGLLPPQQDTSIQLSILKSSGLEVSKLDEFRKVIETNEVSDSEDYEDARQKYIVKVLQTNQVSLSSVIAQGVQWMKERKLPPLPFAHIFLDEFQDVDESQLQLVLLHGLSNVKITVVGDDDQSIYGWRAATGVKAFREVERVLKAKRFVLSDNFRSHSEILSISNQLIKQNLKRIPKTIRSVKGSGGLVQYISYANPSVEADAIALKIAQEPDIETLVLARTGLYLQEVEKYLRERSVEFVNVSASKSFDSIPAQIALNGLMAIGTGDHQKYHALLNLLLATKKESDIVKSSLIYNAPSHGMTGTCKKVHDALFNSRKLFLCGRLNDGFVLYFDIITTQLEVLGYKQLSQLKSMQTYLSRCKGATLKQRYNQLMSNRKIPSQDLIKLMTMHTSKGLEAKRVFVVGVSDSIIPSNKSIIECGENKTLIQSVISEERRLLFVALTRAMSQLYISSVKGTITQPKRYGVSSLLNEVVIEGFI